MADLPRLTVVAGADGSDVRLSSLTAVVSAPTAELSLSQLTVVSGADGAAVSLSSLTATGSGFAGTAADSRDGLAFEKLTATGEASAGTVATAAVEMEEMTAAATAAQTTDITLEELTATGTALAGTIATAAVVLRAPTAEVEAILTNVGSGAAVMQTITVDADGIHVGTGTSELTLANVVATASGISGTVGIGSATLEELTTASVAGPLPVATGSFNLPYLRSTGFSEPTIAATYRTWVMNAQNEALTEYTNFAFNSYAKFNDKEYAAGPNGLYELTGADDQGVNIDWVMRTGAMDDKNMNLKQLNEILMAVKFDGPIRVRVWTDDNTYYDYTLANFREDVLHQVRVKTGKGLKSRYYKVEISGMDNATAEIDAMQLPFVPTTRRIG